MNHPINDYLCNICVDEEIPFVLTHFNELLQSELKEKSYIDILLDIISKSRIEMNTNDYLIVKHSPYNIMLYIDGGIAKPDNHIECYKVPLSYDNFLLIIRQELIDRLSIISEVATFSPESYQILLDNVNTIIGSR